MTFLWRGLFTIALTQGFPLLIEDGRSVEQVGGTMVTIHPKQISEARLHEISPSLHRTLYTHEKKASFVQWDIVNVTTHSCCKPRTFNSFIYHWLQPEIFKTPHLGQPSHLHRSQVKRLCKQCLRQSLLFFLTGICQQSPWEQRVNFVSCPQEDLCVTQEHDTSLR